MRACAVWSVAEAGFDEAVREQVLVSAVADSSPVVREIGLVSLARRHPERARPLAQDRLSDEAPFVRQQAALITAEVAS